MTNPRTTIQPDELAAPLDLLLTSASRPFRSRMIPDRTWLRVASGLAAKPNTLIGRGIDFSSEIGSIVAGGSSRAPHRSDKRFADPAWEQNPVLRRIMQAYLAAADTANQLFADADLDWRDAERMRFVLDNVIEGLAPSNNPLISPLGWKALIDTGGLSAVRGLSAFLRDMASSPRVPAMVEADAFAVGETVATTSGAVVLKTPVFELIQYAPLTPAVRTVPLVIVPPVINKYYVLDIAPDRSMIEYFVRQGQQVFALSWRNPQARHRNWGLDSYGAAILEAVDAAQQITGSPAAHLMGSCSGGILAAMAAAHLTGSGDVDRIASLTLAVTVLDQSQAGFAAAAMSERAARAAIRASAGKGYLDGRTMAEVFAWLRPTDLVWRYWVNNYVQGRSPAPFDVLFWNADTTRMTAALHRDMVLLGTHNWLATPNAVSMLGTPVDLSKVTADAYVIGGIADHICPWQSTYRSARLLGGENNRYVLSSSGHIASLVNPPGNRKASYRAGPVDQEDPHDWLDSTQPEQDSWWPDYARWLGERSGADIDAPAFLGDARHPALAPAPGTYVLQK